MDMTNNLLPEERGWEYKQINVTRVPGYGFGIAVSGGRDNPHFASGDPSIAVSDVLASGPAERILQVNDRIISVNGISLQNVDYATAVQVLRDSGDTVSLVIKRRTIQPHIHQHSHSLPYTGSPLPINNFNSFPSKITLTKNSKKEDFGIVLGCKLFVKEISSKAREQLLTTNQILNEGDFVTKLNNTNCHDLMSLKEAKKIIASTKDKLHVTVIRDLNANNVNHSSNLNVSTHQTQNSLSSLGDDLLANQGYTNQNLYVQPPTRNVNLNNSYDDKLESNSGPNSLNEDKSNLGSRSRSRGPLTEQNLHYLDSRNGTQRIKNRQEPPRPPPPRNEDYYGSRKQLYDGDPIIQKNKQPIPDARFISFHKEGSVGIRLTGGNFVGIFVTAIQPGSPASLQGLQPGDKILKVNDMDMTGVTREEAVLFLLSLQDRIELIVQFCKEEYDNIVASQKGDSFYIKTHYHYENPAKGEMSFKSGDIFHVIDTLYNGVVGCWQVYKIGRNNQELQKGIIPNKSRAEELATAQFNATKKEQSTNESRGSFFKRRRSSNRRSKSLGKEHWDDLLFSDTVSKFPAYERVILKHPGFTRPVIMFGPIADMAREKLSKDFHDKFVSPQLVNTLEDTKLQKNSSNIIRLSAIREVISSGKHALLDITPNAVERLNYAQMYPIVIFFKAETKLIIKQLRQGIPKSAHKSSKKLLEQCHKLDEVWSHIFSATVNLNDNTDNWYRKVRDIIDKSQSGAIWMSENKPDESLSDDFLFPMSSLRLSYASSPESDLEHSPGPPMNASSGSATGRLAKANSDPSVVMMENSPSEVLPSYQVNYDSRYNLNENIEPSSPLSKNSDFGLPSPEIPQTPDSNSLPKSPNYSQTPEKPLDFPTQGMDYSESKDKNLYNYHKRQPSNLLGGYHNKSMNLNESPSRTPSKEGLGFGQVPDLPPRVDRGAKPLGVNSSPSKTPNGRSAHERLFGSRPVFNGEPSSSEGLNKIGSLERGGHTSKSDSLSSYDSFNRQSNNIGPNAHDDLKTKLSKIDINQDPQETPGKYSQNQKMDPSNYRNDLRWDQNTPNKFNAKMSLKYGLPQGGDPNHELNREEQPNAMNSHLRNSLEKDLSYRSPSKHSGSPKTHVETKTDYGKFSRSNGQETNVPKSSHQDLGVPSSHHGPQIPPPNYHMPPNMDPQMNGYDPNHPQSGSYKPIPPPKPKNYKPVYKQGYNGEAQMQVPYNGGRMPTQGDPRNSGTLPGHNYYYNTNANSPSNNNSWQFSESPRYNSYPDQYSMRSPYESRGHPGISYASLSEIQPISSMDNNQMKMKSHNNNGMNGRSPDRPIVDLQSSREQRGSAFELYRKPMHHNLR